MGMWTWFIGAVCGSAVALFGDCDEPSGCMKGMEFDYQTVKKLVD